MPADPGRVRRGRLRGLQDACVGAARRFAEDRAAGEFRGDLRARREQIELRTGRFFLLVEAGDTVAEGKIGLKWIQDHGQTYLFVLY